MLLFLFLFFLGIMVWILRLVTGQQFHLDLTSLWNANMKSYLASRLVLWAEVTSCELIGAIGRSHKSHLSSQLHSKIFSWPSYGERLPPPPWIHHCPAWHCEWSLNVAMVSFWVADGWSERSVCVCVCVCSGGAIPSGCWQKQWWGDTASIRVKLDASQSAAA